MEFVFEIGDKVEIAFNAQPAEETMRQEILGGRKVQAKHQTVAQTGTVLQRTDDGVENSYMVRVDIENLPQGKKRIVLEHNLSKV